MLAIAFLVIFRAAIQLQGFYLVRIGIIAIPCGHCFPSSSLALRLPKLPRFSFFELYAFFCGHPNFRVFSGLANGSLRNG